MYKKKEDWELPYIETIATAKRRIVEFDEKLKELRVQEALFPIHNTYEKYILTIRKTFLLEEIIRWKKIQKTRQPMPKEEELKWML